MVCQRNTDYCQETTRVSLLLDSEYVLLKTGEIGTESSSSTGPVPTELSTIEADNYVNLLGRRQNWVDTELDMVLSTLTSSTSHGSIQIGSAT
ncbi:hypothetical protein Dsin_014644 [Dipteronia sinensis]|uniref:Uncharacterized protein n=1 Tax=Dipteronia sinensis TaxID=43782 RepID=A0AAE0EA72_9ROSI|nr:hypothetical protein Dsin_014644 [Dipteronia sinensis]